MKLNVVISVNRITHGFVCSPRCRESDRVEKPDSQLEYLAPP